MPSITWTHTDMHTGPTAPLGPLQRSVDLMAKIKSFTKTRR